jgi:hypothetical protein
MIIMNDKITIAFEISEDCLDYCYGFTNEDDAEIFRQVRGFYTTELIINDEDAMKEIQYIKDNFINKGLKIYYINMSYVEDENEKVFLSYYSAYKQITTFESINRIITGERYNFYIVAKDEKDALKQAKELRTRLIKEGMWKLNATNVSFNRAKDLEKMRALVNKYKDEAIKEVETLKNK